MKGHAAEINPNLLVALLNKQFFECSEFSFGPNEPKFGQTSFLILAMGAMVRAFGYLNVDQNSDTLSNNPYFMDINTLNL